MQKIAFLWPKSEFHPLGLRTPKNYDVSFGRAGLRDEAEKACKNADYIITPSGAGVIDSPLLDLAPKVKLIQLTGAGYDNVDRGECELRNIPVAHMPGLNAPSVAQTMLQMALRLRRPVTLLKSGGSNEWMNARHDNIHGYELSGRVGIIGYGHIGQAIARLFIGIGLDVIRAKYAEQGAHQVPALALEEVLRTSDILVVALPAKESTKNFLDACLLRKVKQDAIILNCGRGGTVDESAVANLIEIGQIAGAGFDVFEEEPIASDHPLLKLVYKHPNRVLLTAHISGQTIDSKRRNFSIALDNVERVAQGEQPLYQLAPPNCTKL